MIFSYNWLKEYLKGQKLTPQKIAQALTFHSFEVEKLEKRDKDWVLDIDILPNRATDCLSHLGVAREVGAVLKIKFDPPKFQLNKKKNLKTKDFLEVKIENKEDCFRYQGILIFGVKVEASPKWLQERLKVCGILPVNNIVDITNYVMLETGQPIHAFDFEKVKTKTKKSLKKKIVVRRAKKREEILTLDNKTYQLDEDILLITDLENPLAIAGIKGGKNAEITKNTKNIIIEAANFNPKVIHRARKKLKLKTDASWRFENGIDPNLIDFATQRASFLIQKIAGGEILGGKIDFYPQRKPQKKIKLDLKYLESLLGKKIPLFEIKNSLKRLGFEVNSLSSSQILVKVPRFRLDISLPEDLIEEIGRIFGYQKIPSVFPKGILVPPKRNEEIFWTKITQDIWKEQGFSEVYNYSFFGQKEKEIFNWPEKELVKLENPLSFFNKYLRPSLIPNLLKNIKDNLKFFPQIKIFEIGKIFKKTKSQKLKPKVKYSKIKEKKMLAGGLVKKGEKEEGFYLLKGMIESFLAKLGIANVWYDEYQQTPEDSPFFLWHPQKSAELKVAGEEIGFLGEIHPQILEKLEIEEQIFVFDLDFEKLIKLAQEEHEYRPISPYPASIRDLAILVPQETKVVEVLNIINRAGGKIVRDVDLFDVYQGENLPQGKKNFAFHIIYQAEDKTLGSQELNKIHQRIVKALEENPEWEVRR